MKSNQPPKDIKMTLRELLCGVIAVDRGLDQVFRYIWKKDQKNAVKCDRPTLNAVKNSYSSVVTELISKPKTRSYTLPLCVRICKDFFDKTEFVEVCFWNPKYVAPKKGLKPWGGKPPKGYYNCNLSKHNKYFSLAWVPWSKLIDTPIFVEGKATKLPLFAILGEILWELTFYGWTEKNQKIKGDEIKAKIEEAKKDIEEGNLIEISPTKKGGLKIVIPKTVQGQLKEILKKRLSE